MNHAPVDRTRLLLAQAGLLGLFGAGCASYQAQATTQAPPSSLSEQRVMIGRPCEPLRQRLAGGEPRAIFVEVARVSAPLQKPLAQALAAGPVAANPVAALLLSGPEPVSGTWKACRDATCQALVDSTLTIEMAQQPKNAQTPVELSIGITQPGGSPEQASLVTTDQTPASAALPISSGPATIVVTPYYMAEPDGESRRTLVACQARE